MRRRGAGVSEEAGAAAGRATRGSDSLGSDEGLIANRDLLPSRDSSTRSIPIRVNPLGVPDAIFVVLPYVGCPHRDDTGALRHPAITAASPHVTRPHHAPRFLQHDRSRHPRPEMHAPTEFASHERNQHSEPTRHLHAIPPSPAHACCLLEECCRQRSLPAAGLGAGGRAGDAPMA